MGRRRISARYTRRWPAGSTALASSYRSGTHNIRYVLMTTVQSYSSTYTLLCCAHCSFCKPEACCLIGNSHMFGVAGRA